MHEQIREQLENETSPYSHSPSLPDGSALPLAEEAFSAQLCKLGRVAENVTLDAILLRAAVGFGRAKVLERGHEEELRALALTLIREEFGCSEEQIELRANIQSDAAQINTNGIQWQSRNDCGTPEVDEVALQLEVEKRRVVNALIAGAGVKAQNLFYLSEQEIRQIHPELFQHYRAVSAANDLMYWLTNAELQKIVHNLGPSGGTLSVSRLDFSNDQPAVQAQSQLFPFLLHELGKGLAEVLFLDSLPYDHRTRHYVQDQVDTLENEAWDLRIGPLLWERLLQAMPDGTKDTRNTIIRQFARLPAEQFHDTMREVIAGSEEGRARIAELC